MAHFYRTVEGNRGHTSRLGTKSSGIESCVASWDGAIVTEMYWDDAEKINKFTVRNIPWHGVGNSDLLLQGIVG